MQVVDSKSLQQRPLTIAAVTQGPLNVVMRCVARELPCWDFHWAKCSVLFRHSDVERIPRKTIKLHSIICPFFSIWRVRSSLPERRSLILSPSPPLPPRDSFGWFRRANIFESLFRQTLVRKNTCKLSKNVLFDYKPTTASQREMATKKLRRISRCGSLRSPQDPRVSSGVVPGSNGNRRNSWVIFCSVLQLPLSSSVKLNLIHKIREELSHVLQISDWDLRFWWHTSNWMPSDGPGSWWNGICWLISCTQILVLNCFENLETSFAILTGFGLDSERWIITAAVCQMQLIRLKTGLAGICAEIIRDKLVKINLRQNLIILANVDWERNDQFIILMRVE